MGPRREGGQAIIEQRSTILVVEDNALHLKLFRDVLVAHGFDVVALPDETRLDATFEAGRIDAALIDVYLPRVDGVAIIARLRERWDSARLPIIGVSAMPYQDAEGRCMAAGADAFFPKPVGMMVLATRFAALLDARRPAVGSG